MKKIISLCLVLVLTFAALPFATSVTDVSAAGAYTVSEDGGVLTITGTGVIEDLRNEVEDCYSITKVILGDGITKIGNYAFVEFGSLEEIVIPDSVTVIGEHAFENCYALADIVLPKNLTTISDNAFYSCGSLENIDIPEYVVEIGASAFENCTSLKSLVIPNGVKVLKERTFATCHALESVTLPENLISIGENAFECSCILETVDIPNTVTSIGNCAFASCAALNSIELPECITVLGESVFDSCGALTELVIPESVEAIGDMAFFACSALEKINIPANVSKIGVGVFAYCSGLTEITVDSENEAYISIGNCLVETATKTLIAGCNTSVLTADADILHIGNRAFAYSNLSSLVIPDSVISIGTEAFIECRSLISINLPEGLEKIDLAAFAFCSALYEINIPASVSEIGDNAFSYCNGLSTFTVDDENTVYYDSNNCLIEKLSKTIVIGFNNSSIPSDEGILAIADYAFENNYWLSEITIPDTVTYIGDYAFAWSIAKSIYIPASVEYIGEFPFRSCTALKEITVNEENTKFHSNGNCLIETESGTLLVGCVSSVIPDDDSISVIGECAFSGAMDLAEIVIPGSVTQIGNMAFSDCQNLTDITIPFSVSVIGSSVFGGCNNLANVNYGGTAEMWNNISISFGNDCLYSANITYGGESVSVGDFDFIVADDKAILTAYNGADTAVEVPAVINDSIKVIGISASAFATKDALVSVTLPDSIISIDSYAFNACYSLQAVNIPDSVSYIGGYAFCDCSNLKSVNIPDGISRIYENTFYNCSSIKTVQIPSSVKKIDGNVFAYCTSLNNIEIPYGVEGIDYNAFSNCESLTEVVLPDSINYLSSSIFSECYELTSVKLPNSIYDLPYGIFSGCRSLTSINIPESVEHISPYAFNGCSSLEEIIIPEGVTAIEERAFAYCSSIESINIPANVKRIGSSVLEGCSSLSSITVADENESYNDNGNCLIEVDSKTLIAGCNNSVIPDDNSISVIGNDAFYNLSGITEIVIPKSVTKIGSYAFAECENLVSITIPEGVTSIGEYAFAWSALTTVELPASLRELNGGAFNYCTNITSLTVNENNTFYHDIDNCIIETVSKTLIFAPASSTVPNDESVTTIGEYAMAFSDSRYSLEIPDNIVRIEDYAFCGNYNMEYVFIPSSVEFIGEAAFSDAFSLTEVCIEDIEAWCNIEFKTPNANPLWYSGKLSYNNISFENLVLPDGIKTVGKNQFANCYSINSVYIPKSVEVIDENAFMSCGNIWNVYYEGTPEEWAAVTVNFGNETLLNASLNFNSDKVGTEITSVTLTQAPSKTVYYKDVEELDLTDGMLSVNYADGSSKGIEMSSFKLYDFDNSVLGMQTVEIKYGDFSVSFEVEVIVRPISFVAVSSFPAKTQYNAGESLDLTGGQIAVGYPEGVYEIFDITEDMVSGYDANKLGYQVLTITYNDYTTQLTVKVVAAANLDLDGDGNITVLDVALLRDCLMELDELDVTKYDMNGDSLVDARDIVKLKNVVASAQ